MEWHQAILITFETDVFIASFDVKRLHQLHLDFVLVTCLSYDIPLADSDVVDAEPQQYGFLNTPTALNCSTSLDSFVFLVEVTWFRGENDAKTRLNGRPQFGSTAISDEGVYTCKVDITEMGIVIEKMIDFQVIGE